MEYIYAAMLLHKAGKKVDEDSIKKVLAAAGFNPDESRVKALVASLEGVNIDEAIKTAPSVVSAAAPVSGESKGTKAEEKKEKPKQEEKVSEEKAAAGLGALFG
ncbi:50S ribosomal protein P1 [Candidatus Woesearchaeota archaeon]|nr:50S ribosomal protein P1 [Candidatus Woesearchaeota archaeon]